ncbi:TMEM175 family protein [Streptomyces albus]|uniref:TMEM175 family protein n=1 Tax=Streptomyces albus TaxID=1888 RepID=UPI000AE68D88|nr:TMEM175 family protein [Streptomyces albus]
MTNTGPHRDGKGSFGGNGGTAGAGGAQRVETLSDGVFAIAMTLLALDISVPAGLDSAGFHQALSDVLPNIAAYALSFAVIAQFWRDHRSILGAAPAADGAALGLTLLGLALVALLPFPTSLLAEYTDQALAVAVYSGTVAAINAVHTALVVAVRRSETVRDRAGPADGGPTARRRRLAVDSGVTAVVFGAAVPVAFVSPGAAMWSWLALVPLNFVIGRRRRRTRREATHREPAERPPEV